SANHGAAAAVMRSVHLAHSAAGHGAAFSVDLSSARVRLGLELIDGIREGQPLAALIGYRLEQSLVASGFGPDIAPFRKIAPLVANTLTTPAGPVEAVAATNVIDGLMLLEKAGYNGDSMPSLATLWQQAPSLGAMPTGTNAVGLKGALLAAADAVDAVS